MQEKNYREIHFSENMQQTTKNMQDVTQLVYVSKQHISTYFNMIRATDGKMIVFV